jgi:acyl carrier protein
MPESIQERVLRVIATTKRIPLESVHPDSTFEALGIDSLDRLNILFDLESEFDIEIDDEDAKQVTGIPQMVQGIEAILEAKAAGLPAPHFTPSPSPTAPTNETAAEPAAQPDSDTPEVDR